MVKNRLIVIVVIISLIFGTSVQAAKSSEKDKYRQNVAAQKSLDKNVSNKKQESSKIEKEYKAKSAELRKYFTDQVAECTKARDKKLKETKDKIDSLTNLKQKAENELAQAKKNGDNKKIDELKALIEGYKMSIKNLNLVYKEDKSLYNSTIHTLKLRIETIDNNPKKYVQKINKKIKSILTGIDNCNKKIDNNVKLKKYKIVNLYFDELTKLKNSLKKKYVNLYNAYKTKISLLPQK